MSDITMDEIMEICRKMRHVHPRVQWAEDRQAAMRDDYENSRGYLILNPELDLSALEDPHVDGRIIDRDGVEYRVMVDEKMRGMTDEKTGEMRHGFWIAPQKDFLTLDVMLKPRINDINLTLSLPAIPNPIAGGVFSLIEAAVSEDVPPTHKMSEEHILGIPGVRRADEGDPEYVAAIASMAKSIQVAEDGKYLQESEDLVTHRVDVDEDTDGVLFENVNADEFSHISATFKTIVPPAIPADPEAINVVLQPNGQENLFEEISGLQPYHQPLLDRAQYPEWYTPSKERKEGNLRVLQGRHPMGHALGTDPSTKCGNCMHVVQKRFSKVYIKCAKSKQTGGPATDIRMKWRGCEHWVQR